MKNTTRAVNLVISLGVMSVWAWTSLAALKPQALDWSIVVLVACAMSGKGFEKIVEWKSSNAK